MSTSGYHRLVEVASQLTDDTDVLDGLDELTPVDAELILQRWEPIFQACEEILCEECEVPLRYEADFFSYHTQEVQHLRNLSRAIDFAGHGARLRGDDHQTVRHGLANLELGNAVRRGGLVVDHLVSVAIAQMGIDLLRRSRDRYDDTICKRITDALQKHETGREPFATILQRDSRWENESGYFDSSYAKSQINFDEFIDPDSELSVEEQRELIQLFKDLARRPLSERYEQYLAQDRQLVALPRLLVVDLAIRQFQYRKGRLPESLAQLSPEVLEWIPRDPFSDDQFIYRPNNPCFVVYSPGPDRRDAGGKFGPWPAVCFDGCDLCLDANDYWDDYCK
ncbi:MAG: hypothetical protein R3E01_04655 [Pirellulaceae bacterium]|nr:hypothetical protein [Planctomycetales bacterium]